MQPTIMGAMALLPYKVILDLELVVRQLGIDSEVFEKFRNSLISRSEVPEIESDEMDLN